MNVTTTRKLSREKKENRRRQWPTGRKRKTGYSQKSFSFWFFMLIMITKTTEILSRAGKNIHGDQYAIALVQVHTSCIQLHVCIILVIYPLYKLNIYIAHVVHEKWHSLWWCRVFLHFTHSHTHRHKQVAL